MILIYLQLLLLGALCLGWTYWLNQWTTDGTWQWRRSVILFGAGFAVQILLLQNLMYLDIPIQYSFPLPAAVGLYGLWRLIGQWRSATHFDANFRIQFRYGAAIFLVVFSLQSASVIMQGPENYYAKGHIDQLNYGGLSEFIKIEPFSMSDAEMEKQPWLIKASQQKNKRIGQSVAQAYVASLSFVSTKESYGALCSFLVALLALATFVLAQTFSIGRPYCVLAALWVALAPSTTRIHLDGFLSQAAVLFVFPMILIWARLTGESDRFRMVAGGILLSFLFVAYTEFFVIAIFLLVLLTAGLTFLRSHRQIEISGAAAAIGVLLVPAYLPRAYSFAIDQYSFASGLSPAVEVLAPDGGTVYGWAKALVEFPVAPAQVERQITTAVGFLLLGLCCFGLFSRSRRNRLLLAAAAVTPTVFLSVILSAQVLAKYPFQKICDSFAFLWVLLAIRGISLIAVSARRQWGAAAPSVVAVVPGGFLLLAFFGYLSEHRLVATHYSSLALVNRKEYKETLQYVAAHPERTYVIRHPHGLAAGWLAYEGRRSKVYVVSGALSDITLSPGSQTFTKIPDVIDRVTFISINGYRDETTNGGVPDIEVDNPQGQDGGGSARWYWLGNALNVDVFCWTGDKAQEYSLSFNAEPGPANPSPSRTILLTSLRTGQEQPLRFVGLTRLAVPVVILRGKNTFRVESTEPLEHVNRIPNDPRKHLSRLFDFTLSSPKAITDGDPRLSQLTSKDLVPLPLLTPHNPQLEDRAGDQTWYWVGKQMELEVVRLDKSTQKLVYELTFDAQAGPANPDPKRKIRIRNAADSRATEFSFTASGQPTAVFTAAPGSTRLIIEVLSPTEQKVKIPNDPRNHMVRASNFRVKTVRGETTPAKKAPARVPALAGR
ncbi:MAG: hypothetical protein ACKV2U_24560 [Bryobacteraceae bacterium]